MLTRRLLIFLTLLPAAFAGTASIVQAEESRGSAPLAIETFGADVTISPRRVVFEGRRRSAEVMLVNRGNQTVTYRISFTQKRMTESGRLEDLEDPEDFFNPAHELILYSPKQIVLEPRERQTIRLYLRKPADLAPSEYRSHLLFRAIPPAEAVHDVEQLADAEQEGVETQLSLAFGISIPVIVRHGELDSEVSISNLGLAHDAATGRRSVVFDLHRSGQRSLFGDLQASFISSYSGEEQILARRPGQAIYLPIEALRIEMPVRLAPGVDLAGGRLRVSFAPRSQDGGGAMSQEEALAIEELVLP